MLVNMDLHLQKCYFIIWCKRKCCNLTIGGDIACLNVSGTISFTLINRMTTYGILFMSVASELSLVKIFCKSLRADSATKTTDDLDGVFMPWVPRFKWRGWEELRERWWEGR